MSTHDGHKDDHQDITIETMSSPAPKILPAPLPRRLIGCCVDSLIIAAVYVTVVVVTRGFSVPWDISTMLTGATSLAILAFGYYFVQEGLFAATIGKWIMGLRVYGRDGEPCSFRAAFIRNLLRFIDWLPFLYVIAILAVSLSRDGQRVGDRIAATIVTSAPEKDMNPPSAPFLFH